MVAVDEFRVGQVDRWRSVPGILQDDRGKRDRVPIRAARASDKASFQMRQSRCHRDVTKETLVDFRFEVRQPVLTLGSGGARLAREMRRLADAALSAAVDVGDDYIALDLLENALDL